MDLFGFSIAFMLFTVVPLVVQLGRQSASTSPGIEAEQKLSQEHLFPQI